MHLHDLRAALAILRERALDRWMGARLRSIMLEGYIGLYERICTEWDDLSFDQRVQLWWQKEELQRRLFPAPMEPAEQSFDSLHFVMEKIGFSRHERAKIIRNGKAEAGRKSNRPVKKDDPVGVKPTGQDLSIVAAEMYYLLGWPDYLIADEMCDQPSHKPHDKPHDELAANCCMKSLIQRRKALKSSLHKCGIDLPSVRAEQRLRA